MSRDESVNDSVNDSLLNMSGISEGDPFYIRFMKELVSETLSENEMSDLRDKVDTYDTSGITPESFEYIKNKSMYLLGSKFFNCPSEIVFRSFAKILKEIGKKYYSARGKSILNILEKINGRNFNKLTLSGCIIEKLNNSVIIYKEFPKKS